jgi:hypothetical protein
MYILILHNVHYLYIFFANIVAASAKMKNGVLVKPKRFIYIFYTSNY